MVSSTNNSKIYFGNNRCMASPTLCYTIHSCNRNVKETIVITIILFYETVSRLSPILCVYHGTTAEGFIWAALDDMLDRLLWVAINFRRADSSLHRPFSVWIRFNYPIVTRKLKTVYWRMSRDKRPISGGWDLTYSNVSAILVCPRTFALLSFLL